MKITHFAWSIRARRIGSVAVMFAVMSLGACVNIDTGTIPGVAVGETGYSGSDFDGDNDVDQTDLDLFAACVTGPSEPPTAGCESKDADGDNDVDQTDFGIVQRCYSGENIPADPSCVG